MPDDTVPAEVLVRWLGVSERLVRELARKGIVVKAGRNAFKLEESVRSVVEDQRRTIAGKGGASIAAQAAKERSRLAAAMADKAELQNAATRGALLDAGDVEREWTATFAGVRARMLAVPSRAAQRLPHLGAHDVSEIDREVRDALGRSGEERRATHIEERRPRATVLKTPVAKIRHPPTWAARLRRSWRRGRILK